MVNQAFLHGHDPTYADVRHVRWRTSAAFDAERATRVNTPCNTAASLCSVSLAPYTSVFVDAGFAAAIVAAIVRRASDFSNSLF
jgi:hypothetical protein